METLLKHLVGENLEEHVDGGGEDVADVGDDDVGDVGGEDGGDVGDVHAAQDM